MTWSHKTEGDSLRASLFLCCIHLQWISRSLQSHLLHFFLFTAYKTSEEKKEKHEMKKQNKKHKRNQKITKNTARSRRRKMQRIGPVIQMFFVMFLLYFIFFLGSLFLFLLCGFPGQKKHIHITYTIYIYTHLGWVRERFLGKWRPLARTQKDSLKFRRLLSEFWTGKTKKYSGRAGPNPLPLLPQGLQTCFWLFIVCRGSVVS